MGHRWRPSIHGAIASGIDALARLKVLKCDMAQGYFISRPMPFAALLTWLSEPGWVVGMCNFKSSEHARKQPAESA